MSIIRKSMIVLAAALMTSVFSAASFAQPVGFRTVFNPPRASECSPDRTPADSPLCTYPSEISR
jgi:hypothetical protein